MIVSEERTIVVGGGVVAALVIAFGLLSGGGKVSSGQGGDYMIKATFNRVDGLVPGDQVQLGGVRIGTVSTQSLNANYQAVIGLSVNDTIKLPTDTSAAIHTDGLFGSKYVVLEPGGEEQYLKDGDMITFTQDALIVSELLELIISEGKKQAKEAADAKAQIKEARKILDGQQPASRKGDN